MQADTRQQTVGWSPKVLIPTAIQLVAGFALLLLDERDIAIGVLAAAFATLSGGYVASPGVVEETPLN